MRRRVRIIAIFLLLGAIVNVAVAWGCVLRSWNEFAPELWLERPNGDCIKLRKEFGRTSIMHDRSNFAEDFGPPFHVIDEAEMAHQMPAWSIIVDDSTALARIDDTTTVRAMFVLEIGSGWPFRSLHGMSVSPFGALPSERNVGFFAVQSLRDIYGRPKLLPWWPIAPGFAMNTLLYAALLWLLFTAPFALRRRLRLQRGLCPACAYPVGASDVCTECGAALCNPALCNH